MSSMLPPNVSASAFAAALGKFAAVVGEDWVFTSETDLDLYRDAYSPLWGEAAERRASAAVAPSSVDQVQQIVRIANQYKVPLYPISTGKNLGYGGSAPGYSGSVVVDLKRMNRIIEVDDKRHFAIVEPGVSYYDLYNHIQERKLRVWIDVPEPGWGSVVGNALDHGQGWTLGAYRDHFRSHCGMEVVLPSGELLRTGMGAMPNAETWAQFPYGFGPHVDGLFSQGNFGIVTKMGFWLMPEPEAYMTGRVLVPRRRDLIPLVEVITELEHADLIGSPQYDSRLARLPDPTLLALTSRPGGPNDADLDQYAQSRGIPAWECTMPFYGPAETVAANWAYAKRRLRERMPQATFEDGPLFRFPMSAEEKSKVPFRVAIGAPNLEGFSRGGARSKYNPNPMDGHLFFSPVLPKTGEDALKAVRLLAEIYAGTMPGFNPWFFAPQAWLYRSFVMITGFPISRTDAELNRRSREGLLRAIKLAAEHGWGEYRASPIFTDAIADTYSFNNHALRRFAETLKDAVDPNGIMAPGRGGVWPKHLRGGRA